MRIGCLIDDSRPIGEIVDQVQALADAGFASAWCTQIFGPDALTLLAAVGSKVPGIELGTAVVPVYPRHPQMLAQQALTVQAATGNRLCLGIGLSHAVVIEGMWGYSYEKPARYMREYLSILVPLLAGETVAVQGEVLTCNSFAPLTQPGAEAPPVLVAALAPTMLAIAGRMASGTVTWMTGTNTVGDHIVPSITAAAEQAGRPEPRVVVSLPVIVTADPDAAREHVDQFFSIYPNLPSYRAMLDKEGVEAPSAIAFVGDEGQVSAHLDRLADAGATDFVAAAVGSPEETRRTLELLRSWSR
jgi:F420-dependent oxidoreductase-like protein